MDIKNIRELVKLMEFANLRVLEIEEGETSIHLEREPIVAAAQYETAPHETAPRPAAKAAPAPQQKQAAAPAAAPDGAVDFNNIVEIKSPMVGVFYASPSPDAKPFVSVGSRVKKGDALCIVEAMKLMNEITAEADGEIVDVCVDNGQVVEFGQVLFKIF